MADSDHENSNDSSSQMLSFMKTMTEGFNDIKQQNKSMMARLEVLENKRSPPSTASDAMQCAQKTNGSASVTSEQIRNEVDDLFEASEAEEEVRGDNVPIQKEPELEFTVTDTIFSKKTGTSISEGLSSLINRSLLGVDDKTKIDEILDAHPRPYNTEALIVPELNKEIKILDTNIEVKDNQLCRLQKNVCGATAILAEILSDVGKESDRKLTRYDIFKKGNEALCLLAAAHKGVTMARKLNLKQTLAYNIQYLCTKQHNNDNPKRSNAFLFDEDLGYEVDKAVREKKVSQRVSKNFQTGNKRFPNRDQGKFPRRGGQNKDYRKYPYSRNRGQSSKARNHSRPKAQRD